MNIYHLLFAVAAGVGIPVLIFLVWLIIWNIQTGPTMKWIIDEAEKKSAGRRS